MLVGSTKTFTVKIKLETSTSSEQISTITITPEFTRLKGGVGSVVEETYAAYEIGDVVSFAGSNWYVIEDSSSTQDYVALLKQMVLTSAELGSYATSSNSIVVSYYYNDTCHVKNAYGYSERDVSGCDGHNDYAGSKIREFLEGPYINTLKSYNLKTVDGYQIRLITMNELINNLGWVSGSKTNATTTGNYVPEWIYKDFGYDNYWTMTPWSSGALIRIDDNGGSGSVVIGYYVQAVRPVINLYKSAIE